MKSKHRKPLKEKGKRTVPSLSTTATGPKLSLDDLHRIFLHDIERWRAERERQRQQEIAARIRSRLDGRLNSSVPNQSDLINYQAGWGKAFMEDVSRLNPTERQIMRRLYQNMGALDYRSDPFYQITQPVKGQRGRGGVMTDHATAIPGRRVITTTSTAGSPPESTTSTIVQGVTLFQTILDNVASVNGNRKSPNPHRFRVKKIDYGNGKSYSGDIRNNTQIDGAQAVALSLSAPLTNAKTLVYNKALSRLYDKLRGDIDLSIDAFQARQTGVMVNQRFRQGRELFLKRVPFALVEIVKIAKAMKRSNPRDWGSMWLEWTYGWKPFAADIYGAAENMIQGSLHGTSQTQGHRVRCSAQELSDFYTTRTLVQAGVPGVYDTKTVETRYQCRFNCFFAVANTRLNSLAGYTSLNPVSIAWELVPYSFVADWFVNIGGYLRNLESSMLYGNDFVSGYVTERSKQTIKETVDGGIANYSVTHKGSAVTKTFQRSVLGSSPGPRAPGFYPKLGSSRLISAASLLSQQLHSLKHVKEKSDRSDRSGGGKPPFDWNSIIHS